LVIVLAFGENSIKLVRLSILWWLVSMYRTFDPGYEDQSV
jgi:hypothetical protein